MSDALGGGEDYEVLFTVESGALDEVQPAFVERFGGALRQIGRVEQGDGVWMETDGGRRRVKPAGFDHFSGIERD